MNVSDAIAARRSIRSFTTRTMTRADIEPLLHDANLAPNHRITQPWRFHVLGPNARAAYGLALGHRKAKKAADDAAAQRIREETRDAHRAWPGMVIVSMTLAENPEIREEDYAATLMAVQNLCLSAVAHGLGTHIRTGGIMDDPAARTAAGVPDGERIVAVLAVGEPLELPAPKTRRPASELTDWRD